MDSDPGSGIRIKNRTDNGSDNLPGKNKLTKERLFATILIFLVLIIAALGYISCRNYLRHFCHKIESELSTVSDLKVDEISRYIQERLGDGRMLFRRNTFYKAVQGFLEHPEDAKGAKYLRDWITRYATNYQYSGAAILDAKGVLRMEVPQVAGNSYRISATEDLSGVLGLKQVQLKDLYRDESDGRIYMSIIMPVLDEDESSPPIGILVLRIDPETYLYPLIRKRPVSSRTAETFLVRKDGKDVLF